MLKATRLDAALVDYASVRKALASTTEDWRQLNLSMAQLKCLVELYSSGEKSVGGLAEALGIGLPAASLLVDRVVTAGLVERRDDPGDRRRVLLRLTPSGEQTAFRVSQGQAELLQQWMTALTDSDFAALAQGLKALAVAAAGRSSARTGSAGRSTAHRILQAGYYDSIERGDIDAAVNVLDEEVEWSHANVWKRLAGDPAETLRGRAAVAAHLHGRRNLIARLHYRVDYLAFANGQGGFLGHVENGRGRRAPFIGWVELSGDTIKRYIVRPL